MDVDFFGTTGAAPLFQPNGGGILWPPTPTNDEVTYTAKKAAPSASDIGGGWVFSRNGPTPRPSEVAAFAEAVLAASFRPIPPSEVYRGADARSNDPQQRRQGHSVYAFPPTSNNWSGSLSRSRVLDDSHNHGCPHKEQWQSVDHGFRDNREERAKEPVGIDGGRASAWGHGNGISLKRPAGTHAPEQELMDFARSPKYIQSNFALPLPVNTHGIGLPPSRHDLTHRLHASNGRTGDAKKGTPTNPGTLAGTPMSNTTGDPITTAVRRRPRISSPQERQKPFFTTNTEEQYLFPSAKEQFGGDQEPPRRRARAAVVRPWKRASFCSKHKMPGMVNVVTPRCRRDGCGRCASYGHAAERRPLFCSRHAQDGMSNVVSRKCAGVGCIKNPCYGNPGDRRALFCIDHRLDGMSNIVSHVCNVRGFIPQRVVVLSPCALTRWLTQPIVMWRPAEVVPQHKKRAVVLWTILIGGIILYSSYLLYNALRKRKHPSTAFEVSNVVFAYPDVWVCLYDYYGCDEWELEEECVKSTNMTVAGDTSAVFFPGGEYEQTIYGRPKLTPSNGWCVEFEASKITTFLGQERDPANYLDYFLLDMYWYPGGLTNDSKTCVEEGWESHREWLYIFLNDPETGIVSTGIQTPYGCVTNTSASRPFTYMGLGVTREKGLGDDMVSTFKALSISTANFKDKVNGGIEKPYAHLAMEIQQEPNSFETITEVEPFDLAEMFGNVGGFWDLLMLLWPIFFVAASNQVPHLKPRNFKKTVAKGIGGIRTIGDRKGSTKEMYGAKVNDSTMPETSHWSQQGEKVQESEIVDEEQKEFEDEAQKIYSEIQLEATRLQEMQLRLASMARGAPGTAPQVQEPAIVDEEQKDVEDEGQKMYSEMQREVTRLQETQLRLASMARRAAGCEMRGGGR
eukprot:g9404.t1